jgi:hypothetical protein
VKVFIGCPWLIGGGWPNAFCKQICFGFSIAPFFAGEAVFPGQHI